MDSSGVPIIDCSRDSVHPIDLFHERGRDSPREKVDEGIFMGDFTEGDMVFELGDIISQWEVLHDRGGSEPCDGFVLDVDVDE